MARKLIVAQPHGFCAGVRRAVATVGAVLAAHPGETVYVFNEIVHNRAVVDGFRRRGVRFVHDLDEVPEGAVLIFSAHGVSSGVEAAAAARRLRVVDATCPLVTALHRQARALAEAGKQVILIGHPEHPEVIGTLGRLPESARKLVADTPERAAGLPAVAGEAVVLTQTTLNERAITPVLEALRRRFGRDLELDNRHCYATENRQNAVRMLAAKCERILVIGSEHSSNSRELCAVAEASDCLASLIDSPSDIDFAALENVETLGLSAGASAPPELFDATLKLLAEHGFDRIETVCAAEEKQDFPMPAV
ncbi:MAG: 4-hydroxy-3-methylbut-2-enyl diphosphate reductase [Victivallaceae bacterium]|nr:4-hydroxy-3-methylbut-2-enyl diphosphate reductase [Victivallaceae bacterium]